LCKIHYTTDTLKECVTPKSSKPLYYTGVKVFQLYNIDHCRICRRYNSPL